MKLACVYFILITNVLLHVIYGQCPEGWPPLEDICSLKTSLQGNLLLPADMGYANASSNLNRRFTSTPAIAIEVESAEDVRQGILFANTHGIRPTVLSSGHDFLGRSVGNGTLHISLKNMQGFEVNEDDQESVTGVSATIETGSDWTRIYQLAEEAGYLAVGGYCPTVAPGGFTQGGGQSPLSRKIGYAVDNVLAMSVVTYDGSLLNVSPTGIISNIDGREIKLDDTDLFWALRGGGGGTFGVVTDIRTQLHPTTEQYVATNVLYPMINFRGEDIGQDVLTHFAEWYSTTANENTGGAIGVANNKIIPLVRTRGFIYFNILYYGPWEEAWPILKPIVTYQEDQQLFNSRLDRIKNMTTFNEYAESMNVIFPEGEFNYFTVNRLFQEHDFVSEGGEVPFASVLMESLEFDTSIQCWGSTLGGLAALISDESSSIGSAARSATMSFSCSTPTDDPETADYNIAVLQQYAESLYTVGDGIYGNEADYYLESWISEVWGEERYQRLKSIKEQWDPDYMFTCHHCVGDDEDHSNSRFVELPLPNDDELDTCRCI